MPAPTLETPRLLLRPWRDDDVEPFIAMWLDPRTLEFFPWQSTRERAAALAAHLREDLERNGFGWWVLEVKGAAAFAGLIELQNVPFEAAFTPAIEVGWWLAAEHQGNGYATEGARAALDHAFGPLGRNEVVAMTPVANVRSSRVMERLGMTRDPREDFDHPLIEPDTRMNRYVLYRLRSRV